MNPGSDLKDMPSRWTKALDKEFRELALLEATGKITQEQLKRLDKLSRWADRLLV